MSVRQRLLEYPQSTLAEVAEPRVVMSTFGVVVVGDHGDRQADGPEHVEAVEPVRFFTRLVDLVHGDGDPPECQRGGRGKRDRATGAELLGQDRVQR